MAVSKRGERWIATVYDPILRRKRWVGTAATKNEARKLEATAVLARRRSNATVRDYAQTWLELHPRGRRATEVHYRERIGRFVAQNGKRPLESWSRREAREWALENRSLVPTVRAMFADARRDGLIAENPFTDLRIQQSRGRKDLEVLSVDQVALLAEKAREAYGPGFAAFVLTAAYCGMRPGELYALQWPRVRFDRDEIEVVASYSHRAKETTAPKNGNHRTIVMFPEARDALAQVPREDGTFVFRTVTGRRLDHASLSYYWQPVRIAAGLHDLQLYALRHFCAAHLLNTLGHEAEDVAYQLGHTDGGVLVRSLYGHPSEELARERLKGFGRKVVPLRPVSGAFTEQNTP